MDNYSLNITGFSKTAKLLQDNDVQVTDKDLYNIFKKAAKDKSEEYAKKITNEKGIFSGSIDKNDLTASDNIFDNCYLEAAEVSVNDFAENISKEYGIEISEDIIDELTAMAESDDFGETISYKDLKAVQDKEFEKKMQEPETQAEIYGYLKFVIEIEKGAFEYAAENNGVISQGWDDIKNFIPFFSTGSNKTREKISEYDIALNEAKDNPEKLVKVYKDITGCDFSRAEYERFQNDKADLSKSDLKKIVDRYINGQEISRDIVSEIVSAAVAAKFADIELDALKSGDWKAIAAAVAITAAASTAAYLVPQAIEGYTQADGYSDEEKIKDITHGAINGIINALGVGAIKSIAGFGGSLAASAAANGASNATKTTIEISTQLAAGQAGAHIIGDGITGATYLTDAAIEGRKVTGEEFAGVMIPTMAASTVAGFAGTGTSLFRPALTSGSSKSSQILGRFILSAVSGGVAGGAAGMTAVSTNYVINCKQNGEDINFEDWLNVSKESAISGAITGCVGGLVFEGVQLSSGTPAPEGTVKTQKGIIEETGLKYTEYLDEYGNVIATDFDAKQLSTYLQGTDAEPGASARTIRMRILNNPDGIEVKGINTGKTESGMYEEINYADRNVKTGLFDIKGTSKTGFAYDNPALETGTMLPAKNDTNGIYELSEITPQNGNQTETLTPLSPAFGNITGSLPAAAAGNSFVGPQKPALSNNAFGSLGTPDVNNDNAYANGMMLADKPAAETNPGIEKQRTLFKSETLTLEDMLKEKIKGTEYESQEAEILKLMNEYKNSSQGNYYGNDELTELFEFCDYDINALSVMKNAPEDRVNSILATKFFVNNGLITEEEIEQVIGAEQCKTATGSFPKYKKLEAIATANAEKSAADNPAVKLYQLSGCDPKVAAFADSFDCSSIVDAISPSSVIKPERLQNDLGKMIKVIDIKPAVDENGNATDTLIRPEKTFYENGEATECRTEYSGLKIEVKDSELYINGENTGIDVEDETKLPDINIGGDGTFIVDGEEVIIRKIDENGKRIYKELSSENISARTRYKSADKTVIMDYISSEASSDISSMIEILNNESGEPSEIICTKKSDILQGTYDTVKYTLSAYDEDVDVLAAIENGTINDIPVKPGAKAPEILSQATQNDDGSIIYKERFEKDGIVSERTYRQDEKGNEYKYTITGKNGEILSETNRKLTFNDDGSTTTKVNGKTYNAIFNDETRTITIKDETGKETIIDIASKISKMTEENQKMFFEFAKTLPADKLSVLNETASEIEISKNPIVSQMNKDKLSTVDGKFITMHELGHGTDFGLKPDITGEISGNQKVLDSYITELDKFVQNNPQPIQDILYYFSYTGGSGGNGLTELVAESSALSGTYGDEKNVVSLRSQILVREYLNTIAETINIINEKTIK